MFSAMIESASSILHVLHDVARLERVAPGRGEVHLRRLEDLHQEAEERPLRGVACGALTFSHGDPPGWPMMHASRTPTSRPGTKTATPAGAEVASSPPLGPSSGMR